MDRCQTHGLLNCKCKESLAAYLAKQFRESGSDRVDRGQLAADVVGLDGLERWGFLRRTMGGETKG